MTLYDAVIKLQYQVDFLEKTVASQEEIIQQFALLFLCMGAYPPWKSAEEKTEEAK